MPDEKLLSLNKARAKYVSAHITNRLHTQFLKDNRNDDLSSVSCPVIELDEEFYRGLKAAGLSREQIDSAIDDNVKSKVWGLKLKPGDCTAVEISASESTIDLWIKEELARRGAAKECGHV